MRMVLVSTVAALFMTAPGFAQTTTGTISPASAPRVVQPGGPGLANSGPSSIGEVERSGTGADRISNNAAGDSNTERTELGNPNTGRTGGGGGVAGR